MFKFRKSTKEDIKEIMKIIKQAQDYFKANGIDQWQNNYPNDEVIDNDICNNSSYVLLGDDKIIATSAVYMDGEETYNNIYDGKWLSDDKYVTIHRIAVDNNLKGKGIAKEVIDNIEKLALKNHIHSIRVDTHKDNLSMQRLLKKNGFEYCGIIYLADGNSRVAFEKTLI